MTIHDILKNYWNYDQFRPLQEDIIRSVLDGRDTLALLPTGGGKSICFQVPALYRVGMCLVISPLIALMKDQVYNLKKRNIPAEAIYTGMTNLETDRILNNAVKGKLKFLYVSPERLKTQTFRDQLQRMHICLLAIDEAHCISQWGYDFRPPYLDIAEIRPQLQGVSILALTATATERVKADIVQRLQFSKNHQVFQKSFTRANLSYSVFEETNKEQRIATILQRVDGTAIVYARNRLLTVELATYLKQQKINADFYHAGLDTKTRSRKQEEWINNQTRVMVCTNAFGMGIDKPDVRLVIHYAPSESLEAYYQEAGRAGRDEKKAYAVLLTQEGDLQSMYQQLERRFPPLDKVRNVYHALGNYFRIATGAGEGQTFSFDLGDFCKQYQLNAVDTQYSLQILEENSYIQLCEAFNEQSRVWLRADRETIYRLEVAHRRLEPYIKTLLRNYEGIFEDHIPISEANIARSLHTTAEEVRNALSYLQKMDALSYLPAINEPSLTFIQARQAAETLWIDHERLQFRKNVQQNNLHAVEDYITNQQTCRSVALVRYFNENDAPNCGICDYCLTQKKQQLQKQSYNTQLRQHILAIVAQQPCTADEIVAKIKHYSAESLIQMIRELTNESILHQNQAGQIAMAT